MARAIAGTGETPELVVVSNPGDAAAVATAYFEEPPGLAHLHPQIAYDAASGAEIGRVGEAGAATRTGAVMVGLHEAHFAAAPLRLLFFLCGAMGAATVATGLVLWTVARAPTGAASAGLGLRLVRVLNLGTVAGLPFGLAAYFLANRLLLPEERICVAHSSALWDGQALHGWSGDVRTPPRSDGMRQDGRGAHHRSGLLNLQDAPVKPLRTV